MKITLRVEANEKKLHKITKKLKKDGWLEKDGYFYHPEVDDDRDARIRLWRLRLLTTSKARITIERKNIYADAISQQPFGLQM